MRHYGEDSVLPKCPFGGEIKTDFTLKPLCKQCYQSALLGARSKPELSFAYDVLCVTKVPFWGRDQNQLFRQNISGTVLPKCPFGGEIKTQAQAGVSQSVRYQSALLGARSKRQKPDELQLRAVTKVPFWGRDQNGSPDPQEEIIHLLHYLL